MLNSVQQLQVTKAGTIGNVRIVDHAIAPLSASSPKSGLVIPIAIILGLMFGIASLIVQVALLRGIDDPNEVEARLGISAYAAIPYSSQQGKMTLLRSRGRKSEHTLLATADSRDLAIEALRSLRNSLHFLMLESSNNVLMLTGLAPGMGKSFVTANLGAVLAQSGKTVAVIDADLRKGHLHSYVGLTQTPGVSEYVAQGAAIEAVVRTTTVPGLSMVTNGTAPPNPAELLLHERFAEIVRYLSGHFDYVLIDTPPVLPVADAAIVARMAGCTLIVLKSAEHPMREIEETFKRLVQAGANVRGTIFNQVGRRVGTYGYSYYRYDKYG
jgi:tyrosine-protein kinase Etk/Wzc